MDTGPILTLEQTKSIGERAATVLVTWAVARGWIPTGDATVMVGFVVSVIPLVWAWWHNRQQALVQKAATVPNTTVVTVPALAAAAPEKNVVSAAANVVVPA